MKLIKGTHKGVDYEINQCKGCSNMNGELPFEYSIEGDVTSMYSYRIELLEKIVKQEIEEEYL